MQVALVVLAAEGLEGALAVGGLVHRGAGKAEVAGVGQPAIRKLPRSPPVVRWASSINT